MRMHPLTLGRLLPALSGALLLASSLSAQTPLTTKRVIGGLRKPLWVGAPAGDDRIFIAQKNGAIRIVKNGQVTTPNFLALNSLVSNGSEQGLLGMAFHPDYANNGYFYVNYTRGDGATVVARYSVDPGNPDLADPASQQIILVQPQPFSNHNAGALCFGPHDGYLYIPLGDGGSGDDPACNAQKLNTWLGKVLRIDVDGGTPYAVPADNPYVGVPGALPEIFHVGVRNPFRISFDSATGDLYIGDVGQNAREEISFAAAGTSGVNFGWKVMEGTRCNLLGSCPAGQPGCGDPSYQPPIYELFQSAPSNPRSIIGGVVYRGCLIPDLVGTYFFADHYDDLIRSFEYDAMTGTVNNFQDRTAELAPGGGLSINQIACIGEDGFGEILFVDHATTNGEVFKLVPAVAGAASATVWNGSGSNPLCYANVSQPIIGNVWKSEVDVSGHPGALLTRIYANGNAVSGSFVYGYEILVGGPNLFRATVTSSGTVDEFEGPIPCDIALTGATGTVQALILGGSGLELCNALTVVLGSF